VLEWVDDNVDDLIVVVQPPNEANKSTRRLYWHK
jgi:hypothetical protein